MPRESNADVVIKVGRTLESINDGVGRIMHNLAIREIEDIRDPTAIILSRAGVEMAQRFATGNRAEDADENTIR